MASSSTTSVWAVFAGTSNGLMPAKSSPSGLSLIEPPEKSPRHTRFSGMVSFSPSVASQTRSSAGRMLRGVSSSPPTETGVSAKRRGVGVSWLASLTGQTIEAVGHSRTNSAPFTLARPRILPSAMPRGASSSAVIRTVPTFFPAGIRRPLARTPGGSPSMLSVISPSNPSLRTAATSSAMVAPLRSAIGFETAFRSPLRNSMCRAHAASAKSGSALRIIRA